MSRPMTTAETAAALREIIRQMAEAATHPLVSRETVILAKAIGLLAAVVAQRPAMQLALLLEEVGERAEELRLQTPHEGARWYLAEAARNAIRDPLSGGQAMTSSMVRRSALATAAYALLALEALELPPRSPGG